jgi:hypothetical protein
MGYQTQICGEVSCHENTVENATAPMSINKNVHGIATSKISNNSQEQELNSIKLLLN